MAATLWSYASTGRNPRKAESFAGLKDALDTFGLVITTDDATREHITSKYVQSFLNNDTSVKKGSHLGIKLIAVFIFMASFMPYCILKVIWANFHFGTNGKVQNIENCLTSKGSVQWHPNNLVFMAVAWTCRLSTACVRPWT